MAIFGNKGEWSEIYVLFRLLANGKLYAGDGNMNRLASFYQIVSVIRKEIEELSYMPNHDGNVIIANHDMEEIAKIPMSTFARRADELFNTIKSSTGPSFDVPQAEEFMHEIKCAKLKAPSADKSDIKIVIHDQRTGMMHNLGFSIKSQLGGQSTLLNAGENTNITYRILGASLTTDDINHINAIDKQGERMQSLYDHGCQLEYEAFDSDSFYCNLLKIDDGLPLLLSRCLVIANTPNSSKDISNVIDTIANENPAQYPGKDTTVYYSLKMKALLIVSALGMTASKSWNGVYDANGGYIVVKKDGDIVCYHFYDRNELENYLFCNTYFENASRKRYHFGSIYTGHDSLPRLKLNLQIRFRS